MKAMIVRQFGEPGVFVRGELPVPALRPGHVLIRVAASSVNPVDCKIRAGAVPAVSPAFPAVLHGDVAGVVEDVGDGVTTLKRGDEVYACAGGVKGLGGALAEFMLADAALVAKKPAMLGMADAAAIPLVGITAWEALVDRAKAQPGQRVLVHAGAGGVGHIGVQLAKAMGAIVSTTVSTDDKAALAARLGADNVIRYRAESVEQYVARCTGGEGFDVVFDTVGGENLPKCFQAARIGGTVVCIAARTTADLSLMHAKGLTLHVVLMLLPLLTGRGRMHHGAVLERLARLVDAGRVNVACDQQTFAFKDVAAAHAKLQSGNATGKIRLDAAW